jgi:radical SAM protein with 4Fe4S-binding SPASM domain
MSIHTKDLNIAKFYYENNFIGHFYEIINKLPLQELEEGEKKFILQIDSKIQYSNKVNISSISTPIAVFQNKILSDLHLKEIKDNELRKIVFKSGVNYIDIETSSQCNRVCNYCTNSINDRKSKNYFMDLNLYKKIIDQLSEIDYSDRLNYVGYNEPLMHKEILEYISYGKRQLPNASVTVFTNGDYLDYNYLKEIEETGVDNLNISIHQAPGKIYNEGDILERVLGLATKLKLHPVLKFASKKVSVGFDLIGSKLNISMSQRNYNAVGHNRGGLLNTVELQTPARKSACSLPFNQFIIGHTGKVMPCCVLVHDDKNHKESIVGDLNENSIFEVYSNSYYTNFRRSLLNLNEKKGACKTCTGGIDDPIHNDSKLYDMISQFI